MPAVLQQAARLKYRAQILTPVFTRSASGASVETSTTVFATVAADIKTEPGFAVAGRSQQTGEPFMGSREGSQLFHTVYLRYLDAVTPMKKFKFTTGPLVDRTMDILAVNILDRRRWMELYVREQRTSATP